MRFVCLSPPVFSVSYSDSWFGKLVLCMFLTDFCVVDVVFF